MLIVPKKIADVYAKRFAEQNKIANSVNEDSAESTETNEASNACHIPMSPAKDLKESISYCGLLMHDGYQMNKSGDGHKCLCPFHNEKTPSFFVGPNDAYAMCYGCNWKGDIFDYVMERDGVAFKDAFHTLRKYRDHRGGKARRNPLITNKKSSDVSSLSRQEKDIMADAADNLI